MNDEIHNYLNLLLGSQLASVAFVMDYIELHFDGPCITALVLPRLYLGGVLYESGKVGYRDALCGQITKIVRRVSLKEEISLEVEFMDASILSVSLAPEDAVGPESATFRDRQNQYFFVF